MPPDLRSRLDRITNLLFSGGLNNPVTYIDQISYLIYLKLLDEAENERELQARLTGQHTSLFPQQASRYRWSQWRFLSGDKLLKFVRDEVFPYLGSLVREEPDVATYFQDARLQIEDPNVLKEVVDEIDQIAFARLGTDVKGDIFEYLHRVFRRDDRKALRPRNAADGIDGARPAGCGRRPRGDPPKLSLP